MKAPFRTVLHGTCLLKGKHPPGSQLARECPVLRRQRRQEQASGQRGAIDPLPAAADAVQTPKARRLRWMAKRVEAAGGLEAYRRQECERKQASRARRRAQERARRQRQRTPGPEGPA